jgi:DNA-binding MarR family transcriptional regulator
MSDPSDRLINLFGALALGVADRVRWAALGGVALGGETTAALVVIGHAPDLSIEQLRRVLRLSHPGTVRLLNRLTSAGLAVRSIASHDRRVVVIKLTKAGHMRRSALLERRRTALEAILQEISPQDRSVMERSIEAMLRSLPSDATSALTVCRFCNDRLCPNCPMNAFGAIR